MSRHTHRRQIGLAIVLQEITRRGNACEDCGRAFIGSHRHFHWHHRDHATKKFNVMSGLKSGRAVLVEELAKCDFLCVSCHHSRHPRRYPVTGWD